MVVASAWRESKDWRYGKVRTGGWVRLEWR